MVIAKGFVSRPWERYDTSLPLSASSYPVRLQLAGPAKAQPSKAVGRLPVFTT